MKIKSLLLKGSYGVKIVNFDIFNQRIKKFKTTDLKPLYVLDASPLEEL